MVSFCGLPVGPHWLPSGAWPPYAASQGQGGQVPLKGAPVPRRAFHHSVNFQVQSFQAFKIKLSKPQKKFEAIQMLLSGPPGHPLDPNPLSFWTNPLAVSRLETFGNTLGRLFCFSFFVDCLSKAQYLVFVADEKAGGFHFVAFRLRISHPALQVAIIKLTDPPLLGAGHLVPTFRLNRVLWSTTFVFLLAFFLGFCPYGVPIA